MKTKINKKNLEKLGFENIYSCGAPQLGFCPSGYMPNFLQDILECNNYQDLFGNQLPKYYPKSVYCKEFNYQDNCDTFQCSIYVAIYNRKRILFCDSYDNKDFSVVESIEDIMNDEYNYAFFKQNEIIKTHEK